MKNGLSSIWDKNFEGVLPIDFQFKHSLQHRWFRIHYLPDSKRYAESDKEHKIIAERQKQVLEDILGESTEVNYLLGMFIHNKIPVKQIKNDLGEFELFDCVDLYQNNQKVDYGPYNNGDKYGIFILSSKLDIRELRRTLTQITNGSYPHRLCIVDCNKSRIVIPYDGGMDVIMENTHQKELAKNNYVEWLSNREDGL